MKLPLYSSRLPDRHASRLLHAVNSRRGATELLGVAVVLALLAGVGGGMWWFLRDGSDGAQAASLMHEVSRDEFMLTITERGDITSSADVEVRCEVKSNGSTGTTILRLVEEGTSVQPGDFLAQLDSSTLEEEMVTQQIAVNAAEAIMVEAQSTFETSEIALQEYLQGTFVQEQKTIENEIFVAKENLSRAKEYVLHSERLAAKGHITEQQLEADRFAVEKAETELALAETKLMVLEKFTRAMQAKTLEAAIATARAKWDSAKKSYQLEVDKLKVIEDQIEKCTITAPAAGTVVYAHEGDRDDPDEIIKEGTTVREGRAIIRLPDPDKMQVDLEVNEALIKYVAPGLKAAIKPIGFETPLAGTVTHVNQYAEPQSWRQPNVRQYKTIVQIDETHPELRSGMTALTTIECSYLPEVVRVPVQTIYAHGNGYYCFVQGDNGWEARPIERGPTNDKFIVIQGGLNVGEQIALAPRSIRDLVTLPKLSADESQNVVRNVQRSGGSPEATDSGQGDVLAEQSRRSDGERESGELIAQYDSNGDGVIQLDELPDDLRDRIGGFDEDNNGEFDLSEMTAMRAARQSTGDEGASDGPLTGGGQ